jgi:ATPase subunit of ABC transporter with duplicated ATPase domains
MTVYLQARGLDVDVLDGRSLVRDLHLQLGADRVAMIGRNGVGKSSLLAVLAGEEPASAGRVERRGRVAFVPQRVEGSGSPGERRREALERALRSGADLLLLDEPTDALDEASVTWLRRQLAAWRGGVLVASHDVRLLEDFGHFFVVAEGGCRYVPGAFEEVRGQLRDLDVAERERYAKALGVLAAGEAHNHRVNRRRARKKARGRLNELGRCTPKSRLNGKRSYAQVSQARVAGVRRDRAERLRRWARQARRALDVQLPLSVAMPTLPPDDGEDRVRLWDVGIRRDRWLVRGLDLSVGRDRLAVTGPNGAGKTSLLEVVTGQRPPTEGRRMLPCGVGFVDQEAASWVAEESLADWLGRGASPERVAQILAAHRFPLALAARPMASLSPGERIRAALLCLFQWDQLEVLVLDEPTASLDLFGVDALAETLAAWPGGMVVTSHDPGFLRAIGIERRLELDGVGGHTWVVEG